LTAPAPCPFCGAELTAQTPRAPSAPNMGWLHPRVEQGTCPIAPGFCLRPIMLEAWNLRHAAISYTVPEDVPVFVAGSEGRPVTAAFLNACIDHFKKGGKT